MGVPPVLPHVSHVAQLLKWMCLGCDHLLAPRAASYTFSAQMSALSRGLLTTAHDLNDLYRSALNDLGQANINGAGFEALKQSVDECLARACKGGQRIVVFIVG